MIKRIILTVIILTLIVSFMVLVPYGSVSPGLVTKTATIQAVDLTVTIPNVTLPTDTPVPYPIDTPTPAPYAH